MRIEGSKTETDELSLVSVNEDIMLNFEGETPGIILEDDSILLFESVASYNAFLRDSSICYD